MKLYTIGYEGLNIEDFISLLIEQGIDTVVDIRELPLSRKQGFSKNSLRNILNSSGLEYTHVPALGCPKPVRNQYKTDGSWANYKVGFIKHINTQSVAISELSELSKSSNCALLCFEADYNLCHRSLVAQAVKLDSGVDIQHIEVKNLKKVNLDFRSGAYV